MDSLSRGITGRFQKAARIPSTIHAASPSSVTISAKSRSRWRETPVTIRRNHRSRWREIRTSIQKFGFTAPVLVDEAGIILSGHGRVLAAKALELSTIPTRVIAGLSEAKKRAYVIADNKLAQLAGWDTTLLKDELELLIAEDFDIETTGFSTAEIDILFDGVEEPAGRDPDDLQPDDIGAEVVSRLGDLWLLGKHRLHCGNVLAAESYQIVMAGDLAQMVITDAPFNLPVTGHICGKGTTHHKEFLMASGEMTPQQFTQFLHTAFGHIHHYSLDGAINFFFMDWRHMRELLDAAEPLFAPLRQRFDTLARNRQHQPTAIVLQAGTPLRTAQYLAQMLKITFKLCLVSHDILPPTCNTSLSAGF